MLDETPPRPPHWRFSPRLIVAGILCLVCTCLLLVDGLYDQSVERLRLDMWLARADRARTSGDCRGCGQGGGEEERRSRGVETEVDTRGSEWKHDPSDCVRGGASRGDGGGERTVKEEEELEPVQVAGKGGAQEGETINEGRRALVRDVEQQLCGTVGPDWHEYVLVPEGIERPNFGKWCLPRARKNDTGREAVCALIPQVCNDAWKTRRVLEYQSPREGFNQTCFVSEAVRTPNPPFCLPPVFLAGPQKCGTTDLYRHLELHPQIVSVLLKEPHFFSRMINSDIAAAKFIPPKALRNNAFEDIFAYAERYDGLALRVSDAVHFSTAIDGSASTSWDIGTTFSDPPILTPDLLTLFHDSPRLVFQLRDPVTRLVSDFFFFYKKCRQKWGTGEDGSGIAMEDDQALASEFVRAVNRKLDVLNECLAARTVFECMFSMSSRVYWRDYVRLELGLYELFLGAWLAHIPREHVLVVRLEDMGDDAATREHYLSIFDFMGLNVQQTRANTALWKRLLDGRQLNAQKDENRRIQEALIPTETLERIREFYRPFNENLVALLRSPLGPLSGDRRDFERFLWDPE